MARRRALTLITCFVTGSVVGLLGVLNAIAYTAIIFTGPLKDHLGQGVQLGLFSVAIFCLAAVVRKDYVGSLWQPTGISVVILSESVASLSREMPNDTPTALLSTTVALIAASTFVTGGVLWMVGFRRIGQIAKSVPYPVTGGFLAATGYFLVLNGINISSAGTSGFLESMSPETFLKWVAPAIAGAALLLASRKWRLPMILPCAIVSYLLLFNVWMVFGDMTLDQAAESGLLIGGWENAGGSFVLFAPAVFQQVDFAAIAQEIPLLLTIPAVALLGIIMNLSGVENALDTELDLNAELKVAGIANLASSIVGGFVGYQSPSISRFANTFTRTPARLVAIFALVASLASIAFGATFIPLLPRGLLTMVLVYMGADFLMTWIWESRRRMPARDFAIVVAILLAAASFGFIAALVLGLVAASVSFTVSYAKTHAIRARSNGEMRFSSIERSDTQTSILIEHGAETAIFELQGYLFFGTSNTVQTRISEDLESAQIPVLNLVIDLQKVRGMDVSAAQMFDRLERLAKKKNLALSIAAAAPQILKILSASGVARNANYYPTLDDALTQIENGVLTKFQTSVSRELMVPPIISELLNAAERSGLKAHFKKFSKDPDTSILQQGDADDSLVILEAGQIVATIRDTAGGEFRVASFEPGAIIGEIAFCTGTQRTASIRTITPCTIIVVTRIGLDLLAQQNPEIVIRFHKHLEDLLARRLGRTTALVRALQG